MRVAIDTRIVMRDKSLVLVDNRADTGIMPALGTGASCGQPGVHDRYRDRNGEIAAITATSSCGRCGIRRRQAGQRETLRRPA
jgi:hypothetical protein